MTFIRKQDQNIHIARPGPELASADRRESVAAVLRRAREKHGQDVRSVAQVLRIRQAYLEALESGSFDKLPGNAYALGFLRTYAEYLGLNANNIIDRFKEESESPEHQTELVFPEPVAEGRIPGGAIILISVVLLSAAYGGWFYLTNQGQTVADLIPALPDQIQTLIDGESERRNDGPPVERVDETVLSAQAPTAEAPTGEFTGAGEAPIEDSASAEVDVAPVAPDAPAPERVAETAPETAPETVVSEPAPAPEPEPAPSRTLASPVQPAEAPQVAAVPSSDDTVSESASDAYSGPPISSGPAPELEALNREDVTVPTPPVTAPARAAVEAPRAASNPLASQTQPAQIQSTQRLSEAEAEAETRVGALAPQPPVIERTVVIPAPVATRVSLSQASERHRSMAKATRPRASSCAPPRIAGSRSGTARIPCF